jgi:hypothetical protein
MWPEEVKNARRSSSAERGGMSRDCERGSYAGRGVFEKELRAE